MRQFECGGKSFNLPENWDEVSLKTYINIAVLQEGAKEFKVTELYMLKLLEVIVDCEDGDLDELSIDETVELLKATNYVSTIPDFKPIRELQIGDVLYTCPRDLKSLSIGEYISLKTYQENAPNIWKIAPYMLSILWRPTTKVFNEETGQEDLVREKLKPEMIEWRKDLFLNHKAIDLVGSLLFFSGMTNGYTKNTEDYTPQEEVVV